MFRQLLARTRSILDAGDSDEQWDRLTAPTDAATTNTTPAAAAAVTADDDDADEEDEVPGAEAGDTVKAE
jgi:hypothetical protein